MTYEGFTLKAKLLRRQLNEKFPEQLNFRTIKTPTEANPKRETTFVNCIDCTHHQIQANKARKDKGSRGPRAIATTNGIKFDERRKYTHIFASSTGEITHY